MNEEEFKDFKNYIIKYRNLTNDLANKCITPYMLEQFRGYNDRFDYDPDLYSKYDILGKIDELQQRYKQSQNNRNKLKNILQNIEEIIKGSLRNVGFNEDYYEYMLSEGDIEKILDMIPDFEEKEGK